MTKPIVIFGAGGLGREVLALINSLPEWKVIGFFDDAQKKGTRVDEVEILGDRHTLLNWSEEVYVVLAMGNPSQKEELDLFLKDSNSLSYPILIHPNALILKPSRVTLGQGTILTAGCIITTDVQMGKHVLINLNATIGHDTVIGDYSSIMPGVNLAGAVTLGNAVLVGSGANIISEVSIGENATIGAGSVVNHNIGANETAVGVPARSIIRKK
jgi:sugar O-acyltransferase (sialic acid O-acetyltransferase NeuD family)